MTNKYTLSYDFQEIAEVEIDPVLAEKPIKQMAEFWYDWQSFLAENGGDYTKTWLKMLARFLLERRREPDGDEGWCKMDGSFGIKILHSWDFEFSDDNIEIEDSLKNKRA